MAPDDHPELDKTAILDEMMIREYQSMMGCLNWLVTLGRIDIAYAVTSLSRFNAAPTAGHRDRVIRILAIYDVTPTIA